MTYSTQAMLADSQGRLIPQIYDPVTDSYKPLTTDAYNDINVKSGNVDVQVTGSNLEGYGATITQRPDATTVPVGFVYKAVDTQEFWQSNGTSWVVV